MLAILNIKLMAEKNIEDGGVPERAGQKMRYSDEELQLLNGAFSSRLDMLVLLRKFMLQGELTGLETENLAYFRAPQMITILKKTFNPEIDLTTPIGQVVDLWTNIDTKNKDVQGAWLEMAARDLVVSYIKGRLEDLINATDTGIRLASLEFSREKEKEANFVDLSARNTIITHCDFQTGQLWILAGNKKETLSEQTKRLFKDSSK